MAVPARYAGLDVQLRNARRPQPRPQGELERDALHAGAAAGVGRLGRGAARQAHHTGQEVMGLGPIGCYSVSGRDMKVPAVYTSLDARRRNALRHTPRPDADLAQDVAITLTPLPVFADLDATARRARHAALVDDIVAEHAGVRVMGVKRLVSQDPDACPASFHRTDAPRCHAISSTIRKRFLAAYDAFRSLYKAASARLRDRKDADRLEVMKQYPPGALVRPRWYTKAPANLAATWLRGTDDADLALA